MVTRLVSSVAQLHLAATTKQLVRWQATRDSVPVLWAL